jgi:hypothetical protein
VTVRLVVTPDRARLVVEDDGKEEGGGGRDRENATVALTYETPRLGAVGLRLELAPGIVRVRAEVRAGGVAEAAEAAAGALRDRLAAKTGRAAEVTVVPRVDHIDAYA